MKRLVLKKIILFYKLFQLQPIFYTIHMCPVQMYFPWLVIVFVSDKYNYMTRLFLSFFSFWHG